MPYRNSQMMANPQAAASNGFFPAAAASLGDDFMPLKRESKEAKSARKLMGQANDILEEVDNSFLLQKGRRSYPTFAKEEIKLGPLLGMGGFCKVFEVNAIKLSNDDGQEETSGETRKATVSFTIDVKQGSEEKSNGHNQQKEDLGEEDDPHYEVSSARKHMALRVKRNGDARYAIKRLHRDLDDLEKARGMIDLAIEAKYLSVLWHPNIVKMRAMASGSLLNPDFFIVMDRLYDTLNVRIKSWAERYNAAKGNIFGFGAKKEELHKLLTERMIVAYDLSAAFAYMHYNKLIYRDMKKENIAFDVRGDVKIFDFGLCKSTSSSLRAKDSMGRLAYGYNLTPKTGSIPYMAPEVALCLPYDDKCDVFSFATLLWEILALKVAYKGYSRREYMERVVQHKERLVIYRQWPALTKLLISEAWEHDPKKRPDMKRMSAMIRGDLNELSNDDMVQNRTSHMRQRSLHSFRGSSRLKSTPEPLDIVNATSNNTSESEGEAKEEA